MYTILNIKKIKLANNRMVVIKGEEVGEGRIG